ncbi:MAG: methyltransferase domain-containing protein [Patescibacteria group bacterium]|jgi:ubiquinone/menaquinone biosynthesis C-methylase UbiE
MKDASKKTAEVYDKISRIYADTFGEPSFCIDYFIKYLIPGGNILDVGCGPGRDANYFKQKGFEIEGVDLSEKMIELAQKNYPDIKFSVADMRRLDYPAENFDGIFFSFSLIHLPKADVPSVITKVYKILKKGGIIFTAIQEGRSEEIYLPEPFKPTENIFLNIMSRQELKKLLKSAGFDILRFFGRKPRSGKGELEFIKYVLIAKKLSSSAP